MQDISYRIRAVAALGELGDQRSLDLLLRLADDSGHALQSVAAEAIGHLGNSEKSEKILQLLMRFADSEDFSLVCSAVKGLRWFNTRRSWQLIREIAENLHHYGQEQGIIALGYSEDDAANRTVLLNILESDRVYFDNKISAALEGAKRLVGEGSVEPEIHLFKSGCYSATVEEQDALARLTQGASAEQLFKLVPHAAENIQAALLESLLQKEGLDTGTLIEGLMQKQAKQIKISCDVLANRMDKESEKQRKEVNAAILHGLSQMREAWAQRYEKLQANDGSRDLSFQENELALVDSALRRAIWLCGRRQIDEGCLIDMLHQYSHEQRYQGIRLAAVMALSAFDNALEVLTGLLEHAHTDIQHFVASSIAKSDAEITASIKLDVLDRHAFQRMKQNAAIQNSVKQVLKSVDFQSYALPSLVAKKDVSSLADVARDESLSETTRIGAVEALANIATVDSDEVLIAIGKSQTCDEELRKSAWRCLKRSKRLRAAG